MSTRTRTQRRAAKRAQARTRSAMWPGGFVDLPPDSGLKNGDKFTIKGLRRNEDGTLNFACDTGLETVFVARLGG